MKTTEHAERFWYYWWQISKGLPDCLRAEYGNKKLAEIDARRTKRSGRFVGPIRRGVRHYYKDSPR